MATPMTADVLLAVLRAEGCHVVEVREWRTHNRNSKGAFGPINGTITHHTAGVGTQSMVDLCYDGYDDLPGPLCHGMIAKSGTIYLLSSGRANHAGGGDPDVLDAVIAENYGDRPPATNEHQGSAGAVDGNVHFYGWECENAGDGSDPWPAEQLDAIERANAAICRHYGWTEKSCIGHLEWSDWKPDPRGFSMVWMRSLIKERLSNSAGWNRPGGVVSNPGTGTTTPGQTTQYEPFPGASFFMNGSQPALGKVDKRFDAMGKRLVAEGCGRYRVGPGPKLGQADVDSYEAFQRKCGFTGDAAEWPPGKTTWDKLKVPKS